MPSLVCMLLFRGPRTAHLVDVAGKLWVQQLRAVLHAQGVQASPLTVQQQHLGTYNADVPTVPSACAFRTYKYTCEVSPQQAAFCSQGKRTRAPSGDPSLGSHKLSVFAGSHCMPRQQSSTLLCTCYRLFSRRPQQRLRPSYQRSTCSSCSSTRDLW